MRRGPTPVRLEARKPVRLEARKPEIGLDLQAERAQPATVANGTLGVVAPLG